MRRIIHFYLKLYFFIIAECSIARSAWRGGYGPRASLVAQHYSSLA